MRKVFIHSEDYHYGQYLKNLVCLAATTADIDFYKCRGLNNCQGSLRGGLLVVDADSERDLAEIIRSAPIYDISVFWVTGNGSNANPRPGLKVFARPLNSSDFIDSIFDWYKNANQGKNCPRPSEPYLIGNNSRIRDLREKIIKIAESRVSVLVCGSTGTGKGVVALAIHNSSPQRDSNFLALNCSTVPSNLLESELFGYKRGSFTGAWRDKSGLFDLVREGTMFLDEISEMSPYMQAKLLQVLQEKEFCPVGGSRNIKLKARTIAATNADLKKAMDNGRFRSDLYYRLAVVRLDIPLLKDRKEDISVLAQYFLDKFCLLYNKKNFSRPSPEFWELIEAYDWPGNVRELESSIKTMVAMENEDSVMEALRKKVPRELTAEIRHFRNHKTDLDLALKHKMSLKEITDIVAGRAEAEVIKRAMRKTKGKKKAAAAALGVSYKCLLKKINNYGL